MGLALVRTAIQTDVPGLSVGWERHWSEWSDGSFTYTDKKELNLSWDRSYWFFPEFHATPEPGVPPSGLVWTDPQGE